MKRYLLSIFVFTFLYLQGQVQDAWVYLHDKPDSVYYLQHPLEMLSERALERRYRYGIALDVRDVPVDGQYLSEISSIPGVHIAGYSKWLNAVHVQGDSVVLASLTNFHFVDSLVFADHTVLHGNAKFHSVYATKKQAVSTGSFNYGNDTVPYVMHNAYGFHEAGFTGKEVIIGIIDAGFPRADTASVLQHVFQRGGVIDTYNFPDDTTFVYTRHPHGTIVWSVIGGLAEGELVGTAPDARYCLYISEDVYQEMPVEETYWVMAAERADSVGVDVINSSLGYIDFDNPVYNHTWEDLDGQTAFASRGAQIATEKGIHVVIAAGNAGSSSWRKISVPADAKGVIAVGAVDSQKVRTSFSSTGNTADGRIKPDVMSWGYGVKCYYSGQYHYLSGTSLAAPLITGFLADMVQAFPMANPVVMKDFLLKASDRFYSPDSLYGYGIPDFGKMYERMETASQNQLALIHIYPNPFTGSISVSGLLRPQNFVFMDSTGKIILQGTLKGRLYLDFLPPGIYFLVLDVAEKKRIFKLIKSK